MRLVINFLDLVLRNQFDKQMFQQKCPALINFLILRGTVAKKDAGPNNDYFKNDFFKYFLYFF